MKTIGKIMSKKPSKETELFRMWNKNKNISKKEIDKEVGKGFEIDLGDEIKIKMVGFTIVKNNNDELICAYKFRHDKQLILFYKPKNLSEKDRELIEEEILPVIIKATKISGYSLQDMDETLKSIKMEMKLGKGSIK